MDTNNIIYAWLDQNGDPYYIGRTVCLKRRNNDHRCKLNNGNSLPKYRKLRKLLREGFGWDVKVLEEEIATEEELSKRECHWIALYREQGYKLYNLTDGGEDGGNGWRFKSAEEKKLIVEKMRKTNEAKSDEEKRLIRQRKSEAQLRKNANASLAEKKKWADSKRGLKRSDETKRKMSEIRKGMKFSDEHKENLGKARRKRVTTDETRKKCSATSKGKINIGRFKCVSPDGTEFVTEQGLSEFCRKHGLTPSLMIKVANKQRPHHKRWKCERLQQ